MIEGNGWFSIVEFSVKSGVVVGERSIEKGGSYGTESTVWVNSERKQNYLLVVDVANDGGTSGEVSAGMADITASELGILRLDMQASDGIRIINCACRVGSRSSDCNVDGGN